MRPSARHHMLLLPTTSSLLGHADQYGRKLICVTLYCGCYILANVLRHFSNGIIQTISAVAQRISQLVLATSFEAWLAHEHYVGGYSQESLQRIMV
eukprot:1798340-Prymnesium_polylepis.1